MPKGLSSGARAGASLEVVCVVVASGDSGNEKPLGSYMCIKHSHRAWRYCVPLRFDYDADDWAWEWLLVDVHFVMATGFGENRHGDVRRVQRE